MRDIDLFMDSEEGKQLLQGIQNRLKGRTIREIAFIGYAAGITTILYLDGNDYYRLNEEELSTDALRKRFGPLFRCLKEKARKKGGLDHGRPL